MSSEMCEVDQWATADHYTICVHSALKDAIIYDTGLITPEHVRSVRVLVAYANHSKKTLAFRLGQWLLFDTEGFSYEFELRNQFYEEDASLKLQEGVIAPGQRTKGWVAFQVPPKSQPSHIQFRANYSTHNVINVRILQASHHLGEEKDALEVLQCPTCSAPLEITGNPVMAIRCPYCGNTSIRHTSKKV